MTSVIGVLVPCMICVGTVIGRQLQGWSRQSQEQVNTVGTLIRDTSE